MKATLRQAKLSDIETLKTFQNSLVEFERQFDPNIRKEGNVEYYDLKKTIESDQTLFLVAEIDDEIVGCGFGEICKNDDIYSNKYFGFIRLIFVKEKNRGSGIAGMVITALFKWFKEMNISEIRLQTFSENINAIKAYKKLGFTDFVIKMRKVLHPLR